MSATISSCAPRSMGADESGDTATRRDDGLSAQDHATAWTLCAHEPPAPFPEVTIRPNEPVQFDEQRHEARDIESMILLHKERQKTAVLFATLFGMSLVMCFCIYVVFSISYRADQFEGAFCIERTLRNHDIPLNGTWTPCQCVEAYMCSLVPTSDDDPCPSLVSFAVWIYDMKKMGYVFPPIDEKTFRSCWIELY